MKVVFGGSFNPPTIAHEKIIEILSQRYDEVIIVPNGKKYTRKEFFSNQNRIEMLELIAKRYHNVVCTTRGTRLRRPARPAVRGGAGTA